MQTILAFARKPNLNENDAMPTEIVNFCSEMASYLKAKPENVVFVVDSLQSHTMKEEEQRKRYIRLSHLLM